MILVILLLALLVPALADAACTGASPTWNSTVDKASVQSCISQAVSGDTVNIAAGTADYSGGGTTVTNKNVAIIGAGIGQTNLTCNSGGCVFFQMVMTSGGVKSWRISNMTLQFNAVPFQLIGIDSSATSSPTTGWRIDHVRFLNTSASVLAGNHSIWVNGISWGLLDHVAFDGPAFYGIHLQGQLAAEDGTCVPGFTKCYGGVYWNRPTNLGSEEAVYIEDSTVNWTGAGDSQPLNDAQYGGSLVFRHNTFAGGYIQNHSTGHENGKTGGFKLEVYNNTFTGTASTTRWVLMRAGTGVFFNNTVTGYAQNRIDIGGQRETSACQESSKPIFTLCNGASTWDGNTEASGWPCLCGLGRGGASGAQNGGQQTNEPIYNWKNGPEATCATGGACSSSIVISHAFCSGMGTYLKTTGATHTNGQVDYVNNGSTPKPGYAAFTYPHPLQGGADTTPPAAPTGVTVN